MKSNMVFIVPAAGIGSRFNHDLPKQYHKIDDLTVIEHSLRALSYFDAPIVVALHPDDVWFEALDYPKSLNLTCVTGGATRAESVISALHSLKDHPPEWVLVHDAARPCVSVDDIEALIEACHQHKPGGLLVAPSTDTLKYTDGTIVEQTLDRDKIVKALTPQMFQYEILYSAYEQALAKGISITDEASSIEAAGMKPCLVEATSANLKITSPQDLLLAKAIIMEEALICSE